MRINRSNRRRLNSSVSDNFRLSFNFPVIEFMSFDVDVDAPQAIEYINKELADVPAKVDDIIRHGSTYKVHVIFDTDEATGYQAWLDDTSADEEETVISIIYHALKNWGTIKDRLNSGRRRINSSRFDAFDKSGRVKAGYGLPEEMCQIIVDRQTGANYVCLTNDEINDVLEILASIHYEDIAEFSDAVMSGKHPEVDIVAGFRY